MILSVGTIRSGLSPEPLKSKSRQSFLRLSCVWTVSTLYHETHTHTHACMHHARPP